MDSLANVIMTLNTKLKFCQFGSTFAKYDVYGTHKFLKKLEIHFRNSFSSEKDLFLPQDTNKNWCRIWFYTQKSMYIPCVKIAMPLHVESALMTGND